MITGAEKGVYCAVAAPRRLEALIDRVFRTPRLPERRLERAGFAIYNREPGPVRRHGLLRAFRRILDPKEQS
jgi:hypothetical protein